MALKVNYKFLFVGDDKNIFVENYSYDQLFITIEIRNNPSNARAMGKKIWSTMRRCFSANLNEESYKRFKDSLKEVNKVLDELDTKDLSALIGFIAGKELYLAQTGGATAYLARNNSIEIISQGLSEKGGDKFTNIAKGKIMAGDFVVFSSVSLFKYISRVDLAKVLDANAFTDSLSKLNKLISTEISGKAGIIGMTFEKAPKLIKEVVAVTTKKLPHKLLAKIKTPKFLSNIVDYIKKLLLPMRYKKSNLLRIFVVAIPIFVLGIILYAGNSALVPEQISTAVIIERDDEEADNIRRVEDPKVFVDFSTKQPNINPLGLLVLEDKFFAFEHNALHEIDLDKIEELAGFNDSETIVSATDFENQDSLIFTTKSGKLIQYKDGGILFMETTDGEFHKGIAIDDWSNRIYILDPESNQIWRYMHYETFAVGQAYNIDGDLKNAVDFTIDGSIYILNKDGSIEKVSGGRKEDFFIQGEPLTGFNTPSKIYTEEGLNQIFVMDSGTSRIFIYAKDLETGNAVYSGQIVFPTIPDLRDLYVDKNTNKLYLLSAQKVYEVQL